MEKEYARKLFEPLLKNELEGKQEAALREKLKKDQELLEEFKWHVLSRKVGEWDERDQAKNEALQRNIYRNLRAHRRKQILTGWKGVAVILLPLLLIGSILIWKGAQSYTDSALTEQFFAPSFSEGTLSGTADGNFSEADQWLVEGQRAFAEEGYQEAAAQLEKIPPEHPAYLRAQLTLAYALLQLDRSEEALPVLERVIVSRRPDLRQNAEWNKALALLQAGRKEEFRQDLQQILDKPDHDFHNQAQALQSKLNHPLRFFAK